MLCVVCQTTFEGTTHGLYFHHETFEECYESMLQGCDICRMLWYRLSIQEPQSIGQGLLCMLEDKHDYSTGEQWLEMNFYPRDQMEGESPIGVNTLSLILEPVKSL